METAASKLPELKRVAVFDVYGTLTVEKPQSMEMYMNVNHLCEKKKLNPQTYTEQVYQQACNQNFTWLDNHLDVVQLTAFLNETDTSAYQNSMNFLGKEANPVYQAPLKSLFYLPMAELIEYLLTNDFLVYLVSGSDEIFIRGMIKEDEFDDLDQKKLNISESHVLSQTVLLHLSEQDGTYIRTYKFRPPNNWNEGKAERIRMDLGETPPLLAVGSSMGDYPMLSYLFKSASVNGLSMIINHDDSARECSYEDKELLQKAHDNSWLIISMKGDFKRLFPSSVKLAKSAIGY